MAAAGVIIATGQAFANALGGGDAAYGLLFGAVFVGLGTGHRVRPEHRPRPGPRAHLRRGHRRRRRDGPADVLDVHALDRAAARRPHGVLRRHRLPGRVHAARHRGRGRDPRPHLRDRPVAGAGGADPVARGRAVRCGADRPAPRRPRRRHGPGHRRAGHAVRRRPAGPRRRGAGLPADGRRPAGPAAGRRRHRAAAGHHRAPAAGRRRGVHRLRGRRGRRQVDPGAPAAGVADQRGPGRPRHLRAGRDAVRRGDPRDRAGPGARRHRVPLGGAAVRRRPGAARARRAAARRWTPARW